MSERMGNLRPGSRKKSTGPTHGMHVNVPVELYLSLCEEADRRGVSLSELCRLSIDDFIKKELPRTA